MEGGSTRQEQAVDGAEPRRTAFLCARWGMLLIASWQLLSGTFS